MMHNTARMTGSAAPTAIRKPVVTKHEFSRVEAEPFDPAKVSTTLNCLVAQNVRDEAARVDRKMGRA